MAKMLEAVQRYRKIEDVTSTKDDAPPVYLMDEIAEIARSSPENAQSVAEHVQKRLGNKAAVVKWKALRLTRHLCIKGCSQFQKCMQRYSSSVRELVHYKGEPDPFKGDAVNQRVRDTAKETIELLYSASTPAATAPSVQGRIQGFGYSAPSLPVSSTASTSSRIMGFGSDGAVMPPPSSNSSNLSSGLSSAMNSFGGMVRNTFPTNRSEHTSALHQRTASGDSGYGAFGSGSGGSFGNGSGFRQHTAAGLGSAAASNVMVSEFQLVEDICTPGGMRPTPDPEDLRKFVELASGMDGLKIGELLIQKMNSPTWQVVLKALCCLEAVLQQGMTQACGEIAVMFQSDPLTVQIA
eukprot:CAMPEP_0202923474 /NCGR_PEP_ID=MMETSP1392-20130828/78467_1 /ASSEMBLY_ACC=CAM_ASM_000868 /TAXON_ID=225041 /ORGANISM="Chlamydomonas chlamydogama, Strain SAG 11-48b" /LENGTH=351 /DNA_ID=CAMNT_0049617155 /DNA_START=57 /DNA_END=1109 /DNA_ORIENTATION=-